eukprot:GHVS01026305.1.p1 GENE.GHVS01026305.1~~GHVS01026305.1.p1  ORF type:complete len:244 (-),score=37.64 GHVS01026305.1:148-879(-)
MDPVVSPTRTSPTPSSSTSSIPWNFRFDPSFFSSSAHSALSLYGSPPASSSRHSSSAQSLPDPIGYSFINEPKQPDSSAEQTTASSSRGGSSSPVAVELTASNREILIRRSWEASIQPVKSFGMTFFMLYMSGSSSGIFGILIIGYALMNTFKSLIAVGSVFRPFDSVLSTSPSIFSLSNLTTFSGLNNSLVLQKLVYILLSLGALGYVLYFCNTLGLLPINSGDYIGLLPEKRIVERAFGCM